MVELDFNLVYVTNFSSSNVSVINTASNTVVATVPVGAGPEGVAVTPDGASVYVVNTNANSVSVISTATNTVTATTPVGTLPILVALAPEPFASLIAQIRALVAAGVLTQTQGDKLIKKVEEAQEKLANGQLGAAVGQLTAFISQVQGLIDNGTLTAAQGQALIDAANALLNTFSPDISNCGTINHSGNYRLVADLTSTGTCITINVDNVSLNLNGHTITGPSGGGDGTSGVTATGRTALTITGPGTITNFGRGVNFDGVTASQVTGVTTSGNFFGFVVNANSTGNTFSNNTSTGNNQHGFTMNGANNNTFTNNVASNNGANGIFLFAGTGNHFEGNTAQGNGGTDLVDNNAACDSNTWINNIFNTRNQTCIQ